jgi:hypothetical protein
MSTTLPVHSMSESSVPTLKRPRAAKAAGGAKLGLTADASAKRQAAAILEVLAGARTPTEAATALAVSVPRYYQLESRALEGLVAACMPKPKGRVKSPVSEAASLRRQNEHLQREVTRQQALVRVAQRTVGLPPPALPAKNAVGKRRCRRRTARALGVARRLQTDAAATTPPVTLVNGGAQAIG